MKRIIPGAALAAALMMTASAYAATAPAMHRTSLNAKYSNECSSLEGQWSAASSEHAQAHNFHRAEHQAKLGQTSCGSHKVATLRTGVTHYRSALKLIGVKPSI